VNILTRKIARSLLLRGLAVLGGVLITRGVIEANTWTSLAGNEEVIAGLLAVIGLVWDSYTTKTREVAVVAQGIASPISMTVEQVEKSVPSAGFRWPRMSH
jgi:hypothetical protein